MKDIFKEGDRVFAYVFGWGKVIYVDNKDDFPIGVKFDGEDNESFTHDGRYYLGEPQILSFTEYTLEGFSQERPEELPKKGDIVWVRDIDYEEEWQVAFFVDKADNSFIVTRYNPFDGNNFMNWKEMTTKNPYTNEQ
jgi:hypothetical protein